MQPIIATLITSLTINTAPLPPPQTELTPPIKPIPKVALLSQIEAPQPVSKLEPILPPSFTPETYSYTGYNDYELGSCTWGVKQWKPEIGNSWGDAKNWGYSAQAQGWSISQTPIVGAVAWSQAGTWGHVGVVQSVNDDGTFVLREMNHNFIPYEERTRLAYNYEFQYIYK